MAMMKLRTVVLVGVTCLAAVLVLGAGVPQQINYQARIEAEGVPFDGVGLFKFAIVDQAGTNTYWSNDGTSVGGNTPSNAVALNVGGGHLNVMLGNASHPNMGPISASTFAQADAHVRLWFGGKDGTAFERLAPDLALASVPYAMTAETVVDRAITGEKLSRESVWPEHDGRSDCVVSYYAEYTGVNMVNLGALPPDKNLIITDVSFGNIAWDKNHASLEIRITTNGVDTVLFKDKLQTGTGDERRRHVTFRSGLAVPAGATLWAGGFRAEPTGAQSCTIAGFEIPVE